MKIIAKHAAGQVLKRDGFQISSEAKAAKKLDPTIVDGTLGTFYYEDSLFKGFKSVDKVMKHLNDEEFYSYSTSDGGEVATNAILNWVFRNRRSEIEKELTVKLIPTPGGTGAITASVFNSLDPGEIFLIPDLCWGPYIGIATNRGYKVEKYSLFQGNKFNLNDFIKKANAIIEKQGKLVTIINDPCNNPTGYSMKNSELASLIEYFNSKNDIPIVLLFDVAYIDFAVEGMDKTREKYVELTKCNDNIVTCICFSASKTFAVYGQRLGAQIILSKNKDQAIEYFNAGNFTARNTWSNCNKAVLSMLIKMDKDKELQKRFLKELNVVIKILKKRAKIFLTEAKACKLKVHPYKGGFFATIPVKDNIKVLDMVRDEEKIYLLPFEKSVRIALCSIPCKELHGVANRIKSIVDKE